MRKKYDSLNGMRAYAAIAILAMHVLENSEYTGIASTVSTKVDILKWLIYIVSDIPLNSNIVEFIKENRERCYVVTGNLDIWISGLMKKIGMENHCYCSKAEVVNNRISKVISVADKELIVKQFVQPMVAIGDGDNDSGMARLSEVAIGFGGVREIAPSLFRNINFAFYDDRRCAEFLWDLL